MSWASSNAALVSEVSNAGGMGVIAAGPMRPDDFQKALREIKARTKKPFGVNIPLNGARTAELLEIAYQEKIPVIIVEPYFDTKTPNSIASKTGAKVLRFYPSVGGTPQIPDYFTLFDTDIDTLVNALKSR